MPLVLVITLSVIVALVALVLCFSPSGVHCIVTDIRDVLWHMRTQSRQRYWKSVQVDLLENKDEDLVKVGIYPHLRSVYRKKESIRAVEFLAKEDALFDKLNALITPKTPAGRWRADTLFRRSCRAPGKEANKRIYVSALTADLLARVHGPRIEEALRRVAECTRNEVEDLFPPLVKLHCELIWELHLGRKATSYELSFTMDLFDAATRVVNKKVPFVFLDRSRIVWRTDAMLRHFKRARPSPGSIVAVWLRKGFSKDRCYIEMAHNIFAMSVAWTTLCLKALDLIHDGKVPARVPEGPCYGGGRECGGAVKAHLQEIVHMTMPAPVVSSNDKKTRSLLVHNLNLHRVGSASRTSGANWAPAVPSRPVSTPRTRSPPPGSRSTAPTTPALRLGSAAGAAPEKS